MKRRGWRVALTVATLGIAIVAGLVAFNWATVRDHAEAWWFQATRETRMATPESQEGKQWIYQQLADCFKCPVVFDPAEPVIIWEIGPHEPQHCLVMGEATIRAMREGGFHLLEQRFPRRAYVVVGYPAEESPPDGMRISGPPSLPPPK